MSRYEWDENQLSGNETIIARYFGAKEAWAKKKEEQISIANISPNIAPHLADKHQIDATSFPKASIKFSEKFLLIICELNRASNTYPLEKIKRIGMLNETL